MPEMVIYTQLDSGIHRFYWKDVGSSTIAQYIQLFIQLHEAAPKNSMLYILHDFQDTGTPSFNAISNIMKSFKLRDDLVLRIAHLYRDSIYPTIMKNATRIAHYNVNREFFKVDEEQQAIEWLLKDSVSK